jgi:hypothetical protein
LELIFEIIFELFGELLIQIGGEAIADLFAFKAAQHRADRLNRCGTRPVTQAPEPSIFWQVFAKCMAYTVAGAAIGWLSTLLFPHLLIRNDVLQIVYIAVAPVLAALTMVWLGAWRRKRDQPAVGFDHFMYAYCFALSMAVIRHAYAA